VTAGRSSATAALIEGHPSLWRGATTAAFLNGVADGTLPPEAFDRWLAQDRWFVVDLVRAWGLLLQSAPREDFDLLIGGMRAFSDELDWFEQMAVGRGGERGRLNLDQPRLESTVRYGEELRRLSSLPYSQAMVAMWAVEAAYLTAWDQLHVAGSSYADYITHWANQEFAGFVANMAQVVDRELPDGPTPQAVAAFTSVCRHEAAFWSMTTGR
jgi:thiaminase/transcriptional activator TenA